MHEFPTLHEIGQALYGPRWQSELARALGVSDRTMRRWVADPSTVPPGIYADCLPLIIERGAILLRLGARLSR